MLPRDQFAGPDGAFDACLYAETMGRASERCRGEPACNRPGRNFPRLSRAVEQPAAHRHGTVPFRVGRERGSTATSTRLLSTTSDALRQTVSRCASCATPDGLRAGVARRRIRLGAVAAGRLRGGQGRTRDRSSRATRTPLYSLLAYNLRPGSLFAEHALRSAVELCIDKPATVDAATNGTGDVIYSPIDPISWAFQPDLRHPQRDVAAARRLIESAGWVEGDDGVYVRDERRLAADVYVHADDTQRTRFVDLVAEQVRDCGIELNVVRADPVTVLEPLLTYPAHGARI